MAELARQQFRKALLVLVGPGDIKDRLERACLTSLLLLEEDDLPKSVRKRFLDLGEALTREDPKSDEGVLRATLHAMPDEEAERWAREIVELYEILAKPPRFPKS